MVSELYVILLTNLNLNELFVRDDAAVLVLKVSSVFKVGFALFTKN